MFVLKKDGVTQERFDDAKIKVAVSKSAERVLVQISDTEYEDICSEIHKKLENFGYKQDSAIPVTVMHSVVELTLDKFNPAVAKSYRDFRNYKVNFVHMLDKIYKKSKDIRYIGEDVSNANTDSTMISTQRSLIYGYFNKELYQMFFLNAAERKATNDGYIYTHDMKDRLDGINCCLFNMRNVLANGFEMGNIWYNEPNTLDVVFDVIGDITFGASAQQYGGFTIPQVDKILAPYAEKSYQKYYKKYFKLIMSDKRKTVKSLGVDWDSLTEDKMKELWSQADEMAKEEAENDVRREFEQGFQGWEYKFNTVGSSRGDYPFIAMSFGVGTSKWEKMASEMALKVRMAGQGKAGYKKPVLFPKLTFLYDENLHGENAPMEDLFDLGIRCSSKSMYPDFLSLTGEGYIPSIYKKYGKVISLMGCRASLSPWFERGGMEPADENDVPVFEGRFNMGAISLHLPMILAQAREENREFYEVLDYYLEMIRGIHKKTFEYLSEKKASTNPLGFCQGGFLGGNLKPNEKIGPLLRAMTMSFGITALNELQQLYNGKSIVEDGEFALEVMEHINQRVDEFKKADNILYAIYGTPAESLCGTQVQQFRKKYGVIENVSSRPYVSNSFHCGVWEDITPAQKQDYERRFWPYFNGGKIQYCKYPIPYNFEAQKSLVRRAMEYGFYEGLNLSLSYCEDCGYEQLDMDECPKCGSRFVTKIDRMNGYLQYSRIHGKCRSNDAKMAEIADRKSM